MLKEQGHFLFIHVGFLLWFWSIRQVHLEKNKQGQCLFAFILKEGQSSHLEAVPAYSPALRSI
jgi:hypothetical protein